MVEDWSLVYKISLLVTIVFHPNHRSRVYSFYYLLAWTILGLVRNCLPLTQGWFLYQTGYEIILILIAMLFLPKNWQTKIIIAHSVMLILLNLHQYFGWYKGSIFYDSFLSTQDYIYWNKWGFEIILLMLWMKEEVFSAIKSRWTVNNVIMVYIIGWVVYLAGNY